MPGGSWNDPQIYENFSEFIAAMSSTSGSAYISLSDPHIMNGEFIGQGNGSESNPYVVSTYREMLLVTGASDVFKCKLMDDDQDLTDLTIPRRYWYNDGTRTIYCLYDPGPTTVDCNEYWPTGRDTLQNRKHTDFNGWTLINLVVNISTKSDNRTYGSNYGFISGMGSKDNLIRRMILSNCKINIPSGRGQYSLINCDLEDCMMQLDIDAGLHTDITYITFRGDYGGNLNRVTMHFKFTGNRSFTNSSLRPCLQNSSYVGDNSKPIWTDCVVDFDVYAYNMGTGSSDNLCYIVPVRSTLKGNINILSVGGGYCFKRSSDTIFDLSFPGDYALPRPDSSSRSVYNKTKMTSWTDMAGLSGVTTAELLQPTVLQQKGLSIGVDT